MNCAPTSRNSQICAYMGGCQQSWSLFGHPFISAGKSVYFFVVWSFFVVWAFRVFFFAVWAGAFFVLLFGRGPRPRPNSKKQKKTRPRPNSQKKKKTPPPLPSVFFCCCLGGLVCLFFCCLGGGLVFFLLFGRRGVGRGGGRVLFFAVWAGACFFFAVWAGGVFFFLLFGPGACSFFAVWAGDGSSLTYPSAWLAFKRPNNKRDRTAKQKTWVPISALSYKIQGAQNSTKGTDHNADNPQSLPKSNSVKNTINLNLNPQP